MAANTVNLSQVIQEKIWASNSESSTSDLLNLLKAANRLNYGSTIESYANTTYFPDANTHNTNLAYDLEDGVFYTSRNGAWVYVGTSAEAGGAAAWTFGGTNYGYTSGGYPTTNVIDKFSFSADGNATDVGNLTVARRLASGQSSADYGYSSGGPSSNVIDKFSFSADGNATDVGNLTVARSWHAGQSSSEYGYTSGGSPASNVIDKFPFATDGDASDVGDLTVARYGGAGQSSTDYGYTSGGVPGTSNVIDKFSFTSDGNATDVGDLSSIRGRAAGQSSSDYGYTSGGWPTSNVIDKFSFTSDGNATDVGDLTVERGMVTGQSSTDYGYTSGGWPGTQPISPGPTNTIDKFPFAADGNATDVGDLTVARRYAAGQQY